MIIPVRWRLPRRVVVTSAVVGAVGLLGACGQGATADGGPGGWAEPGWVAQFRQEMEEDQAAWIACYAEFGVEASADPSGGVSLPIIEGPVPPGLLELWEDAGMECFARLGQFRQWALPLDGAAYQRMLDSRACLVAHGHDVPEAPAEEVWIEEGGDWTPHGEWLESRLLVTTPRLTAAEWAELNEQCPQPGPRTAGISGLD